MSGSPVNEDPDQTLPYRGVTHADDPAIKVANIVIQSQTKHMRDIRDTITGSFEQAPVKARSKWKLTNENLGNPSNIDNSIGELEEVTLIQIILLGFKQTLAIKTKIVQRLVKTATSVIQTADTLTQQKPLTIAMSNN